MVGNHEQGLLTQAQPLGFHSCCHHLKGLACTHHMGQQSVAAIEDVGDGIDLMAAQGDFRRHAVECDVASVVLTGPVGVEQDIVCLADGFAPVRVFPNPLCESLLQQFLLTLGDGGFFLVQHCSPAPICIIHIVEDADILQVQTGLDDFIGIDPLGAVGAVGLDIAPVLALALDPPLAGGFGVMYLDFPLCAAWRSQCFKDKLPDIFGVQPCSTQTHGDLAGRQVHRLHLCKRIGIDLEAWVLRCLCCGVGQLLPYIAREVFICREVFVVDALGVVRVQEHHAGQFCEQGVLVLAGQLAHILHIHPCLFANGQSQRLHRSIHTLGRLVAADGPLGEQVCLALQFSILVQNFQRA